VYALALAWTEHVGTVTFVDAIFDFVFQTRFHQFIIYQGITSLVRKRTPARFGIVKWTGKVE